MAVDRRPANRAFDLGMAHGIVARHAGVDRYRPTMVAPDARDQYNAGYQAGNPDSTPTPQETQCESD